MPGCCPGVVGSTVVFYKLSTNVNCDYRIKHLVDLLALET